LAFHFSFLFIFLFFHFNFSIFNLFINFQFYILLFFQFDSIIFYIFVIVLQAHFWGGGDCKHTLLPVNLSNTYVFGEFNLMRGLVHSASGCGWVCLYIYIYICTYIYIYIFRNLSYVNINIGYTKLVVILKIFKLKSTKSYLPPLLPCLVGPAHQPTNQPTMYM